MGILSASVLVVNESEMLQNEKIKRLVYLKEIKTKKYNKTRKKTK